MFLERLSLSSRMLTIVSGPPFSFSAITRPRICPPGVNGLAILGDREMQTLPQRGANCTGNSMPAAASGAILSNIFYWILSLLTLALKMSLPDFRIQLSFVCFELPLSFSLLPFSNVYSLPLITAFPHFALTTSASIAHPL